MGMFDTVKCLYKLPYNTTQLAELMLLDEKAAEQDEFQTKSLYCLMDNYLIEGDGQLKVNKWPSKKWKKVTNTCKIEMYNYLTNDILDHDLDYKWSIKFKKGVVSKCKLLHMTRHDNSNRLKTQRMWKEEREKTKRRQSMLLWKIYNVLWRTPLRVFFKYYRRLLSFIPSSHVVERWLRVWG